MYKCVAQLQLPLVCYTGFVSSFVDIERLVIKVVLGK